MSTCSIADCGQPHKAKGYCSRHYQRLMKHGDASFTLQPEASLADRTCGSCGGDTSGMKSNAIYCSRACKLRARNARNLADADKRTALNAKYRLRYQSERETRKASARDYYHRNAEAYRERSREYRRENPDRRRAQQDKRADLIQGHPDYRPFPASEWVRLKARHLNACAYCGADDVPLEQDHVVPISRGGRHAIANILPACKPCNTSKNSSFLTEWRLRKGTTARDALDRRGAEAA